MMDDLTWTCHFCHDERPDAQIGVAKADITPPGYGWKPGTAMEHRRYCLDREACVVAAACWRQEAERKAKEEPNWKQKTA